MSSTWAVTILSPLIGLIISNIMWTSPMKPILLTRKDNDLGQMNPVPFVIIVFNCIGWSIYACVKHDYFIFFTNSTGLLFGIFYSVSLISVLSYMLCKESNKKLLDKAKIDDIITKKYHCEVLLLVSVGFWLAVSVIAAIILNNSESNRQLAITFVGALCCCATVAYYAAPISSIIQIIRTSDATSIYLPTIIVNCINAVCWFIYGIFGVHDLVVWLPNIIGAVLAMSQIFVKLFYTYVIYPTELDIIDKTDINYLPDESKDLSNDNGSEV